MKLHYRGKYDRNEASLPRLPHKEGAVHFREAEDSKKLGRIANGIAVAVLAGLGPVLYLRLRDAQVFWNGVGTGALISLLCLFPHELLHALCFRKDVYLYTNFRQGMLFVVGPEDMSRSRFVFMSLLPNLVLGALPFLLALLVPQWAVLGGLGLLSLSMGGGDYYNVYNALTQMPKGARTYLHGFHSYWYMP